MNILLEDNENKFLEYYLEVKNLSFIKDICENQDIYFGKHIKKNIFYCEEKEISYIFPKHIFCSFTKNDKKMAIKFKTKDFIVSEYYKDGNKYQLDINKVAKFLLEKLNEVKL